MSKEQRSTKFSHKFGFSNADEFEAAVKFIAQLYRQFTLRQVNDTELICYFAHLNQDLQQSVADVIGVRRAEVEEFLVAEYNARDAKLMMSFDWDVKWVMGTSALATLRQQLATLVLVCRKPTGNDGDGATAGTIAMESVCMEMTSTMVKKMIGVLEECDRKLDAAMKLDDDEQNHQEQQQLQLQQQLNETTAAVVVAAASTTVASKPIISARKPSLVQSTEATSVVVKSQS